MVVIRKEMRDRMTSNGVSKILDSMSLAKGQGSGKTSSQGEGFDMVLNGTAAALPQQSSVDVLPGKQSPEVLKESYHKAKTENGYKDIVKVEGQNSRTKEGQLEKKLEELKEQVTEAIAEALNVTVEDVLEAMEQLGISMENLLAGQGLAGLVKQLTQATDMTSLLFDSNFRSLMQQVESMVQEFAQENGLSTPELEALLERLVNGQMTEVPTEGAKQESKAEEITVTETLREHEGETLPNQEIKSDQKELDRGQQLQSPENALKGQEQTEASDLDGNMQKDNGQWGMNSREKSIFDTEPSQPQQMSYQTVENTVRSVGEQIVETVERVFVDAEDIMRQVTEFTRVTVQAAQSSIEMQLNPAHLGRIYLQVASRDGVITAQLAAQNEAVKQVLESQAATLRENMNQQGLKVEAVEVTIASHEFEQNLEGEHRQAQGEQTEDKGNKSRRFLSADQLEAMADTMTEEESLAAKIMLENGNSMDMTA